MELLSFASRLFAPKLLDHLLTTYVCHSNPFFLASERNGRNRPLREAPCTVLVTLSGPNRAGPDPFIFLCQARWTLWLVISFLFYFWQAMYWKAVSLYPTTKPCPSLSCRWVCQAFTREHVLYVYHTIATTVLLYAPEGTRRPNGGSPWPCYDIIQPQRKEVTRKSYHDTLCREGLCKAVCGLHASARRQSLQKGVGGWLSRMCQTFSLVCRAQSGRAELDYKYTSESRRIT